MRVTVDHERCLLGLGKKCGLCIQICPKRVLEISKRRVQALQPDECILCQCCKGSCPAGFDVINIEEEICAKPIAVSKAQRNGERLRVRLGSLLLPTPLILASGPIGRCSQGWIDAVHAGLGAVVTKTTLPVPWPGNASVRIMPFQRDMLVNCEGLPNLGAQRIAEEVQKVRGLLGDAALTVSMTASTEEEFVEMARLFEGSGADALELALMGCPNYSSTSGKEVQVWNDDPGRAFRLIDRIRKAISVPIWVKGVSSKNLAKVVEEAGADALVIRSGSLRALPLDPESGRFILSHPLGEGSLTGPYTKLPGIKIVADMAREVKIPIIGNGGVTCGQDVIDYIRVGASAVELLTVLIRRGMRVVASILDEIDSFLEKSRYETLEEFKIKSLSIIRKAE